MGSNYSEIPKRLSAYRKALNMSQEEMGRQFAVNQSHYYKLETGVKIISYNSMEQFQKNGGDLCYLITGEKYQHGITDEYIGRCRTQTGRAETMKLILWLTEQGILLHSGNTEELDEKMWKHIKLAEWEKEDASVWKTIRMIENLSQIQMAEKLDINIKRYRRIEERKVGPDAEILRILYMEFGYSPLVILDRESYYMNEINSVWDSFPENIRKYLNRLLDENIKLIDRYESMQT